jgi:hypothetical protein
VNNGQFNRAFALADGAPAFTEFFGLDKAPNQGGKPNAALPSNGLFFLPNNVFAFFRCKESEDARFNEIVAATSSQSQTWLLQFDRLTL